MNDSNGQLMAEVAKGAKGVVGCTPILKPQTCFSYYSGTDLNTKGGSMHGSFEMAILDAKGLPKETFDAEVDPFQFIAPDECFL